MGDFTVGRSPSNDLVVVEPHVSSRHLRMVKHGSMIEVVDLNSAGGTWVNGSKVDRAFIQPGEDLKLSAHYTFNWNDPVFRGWFTVGNTAASANSLLIGRGDDCDLQVFHHTVSRNHAKLTFNHRGLMIEDLSSSGGTFVNGHRITQTLIQPGDEVVLANTITLDWEHPVLAQWLRENGVKLSSSGFWSPLKIVAASISAAAAIVVPVLLLLNGGYSSSAVAEPGRTTRVGIDGVVATIPGDAVAQPVRISVACTDPQPGMQSNATLESSVYTFTSEQEQFNSAIQIDFDINDESFGPSTRMFPAYWNGNEWVQVFADQNGDDLGVTTDHLSSWSIISVTELSNPLTALLPQVTEAVFSTEEIAWENLQEDFSQIQTHSDVFFGNGVPEIPSLEVSGSARQSVFVNGQEYFLVSTNIDATDKT